MKLVTCLSISLFATVLTVSPMSFAKAKTGVSAQQAANIAAKKVGGRVTDVDYESRTNGKSYYKVEVRKSNGREYKVYVNAQTGKVISSRVDYDDDRYDRDDD